jgi:catechol 2,3-dioxygenase-like lactoylglutathione lyase family enzyme
MFRHVGIVVHDIEKQLKFYRDLLGFEVYYSQVEQGFFLENLVGFAGANANIYKLGKDGKTVVELLKFNKNIETGKKELNSYGITHFAITVEKLDDLYLNLLSNGVKFIKKPLISEDGKHKVCFCQDFEENYIELVEKIK